MARAARGRGAELSARPPARHRRDRDLRRQIAQIVDFAGLYARPDHPDKDAAEFRPALPFVRHRLPFTPDMPPLPGHPHYRAKLAILAGPTGWLAWRAVGQVRRGRNGRGS